MDPGPQDSQDGKLGWTVSWAAVAAFAASAAELYFMVVPFGVYYYAVWSRVLTTFQGTPLNWLNELYMRHITPWPSPWLEPLRTKTLWLLYGGLALFAVHAAHLYWMKFVRKGIADRLLYAYVRHPQYLCLMAAGLGLALRWPRFLDLVLWLAMVGAYLWLAGHEERRMSRRFGEAYELYKERTAMLFPGSPGARLARALFPERGRRLLGFTVFAGAVLAGAFALRAASLRTIPMWLDREGGPVLVLAPDSAAAADPRPLVASLRRELGKGETQPGEILVVFLLRDPDAAGHLMTDSGIDRAFPRYARTPDAALFLLAARARRAGRPFSDPRDALGLNVVRKPLGIYYLPRGSRNLKLERSEWHGEYPHASVPVL